MDELEKLFSMLEVLRNKEETCNKKVLEEGPSFQYTFGFLLGEYNLKNKYILEVLDIIKITGNQICYDIFHYHYVFIFKK